MPAEAPIHAPACPRCHGDMEPVPEVGFLCVEPRCHPGARLIAVTLVPNGLIDVWAPEVPTAVCATALTMAAQVLAVHAQRVQRDRGLWDRRN